MKIEKNTEKNPAQKLGDILIPFVIYFLVYLISASCMTVLLAVVRQIAGDSIRNFTVEYEKTITGIINGVAMLLGTVPLIPTLQRELNASGINLKKPDKRFGMGIAVLLTITLAITSPLAVNGLFTCFHFLEKSQTYSQVADNQYGVLFPVGLFLYGVVSPFAEELVFRGILYNRMKRYFTVLSAVIFSAMLFGIYHGNIVQGIYGFIMGALMAYIYEKFGSFLYPLLFHAAANLTTYSIGASRYLYDIFMTPVIYVVCAVISGGILLFLILIGNYSTAWKNRRFFPR